MHGETCSVSLVPAARATPSNLPHPQVKRGRRGAAEADSDQARKGDSVRSRLPSLGVRKMLWKPPERLPTPASPRRPKSRPRPPPPTRGAAATEAQVWRAGPRGPPATATHVRQCPAGRPGAARGLRRGREERPVSTRGQRWRLRRQRPPSRPPARRRPPRRKPAPASPDHHSGGADGGVGLGGRRRRRLGTGATYPPSCGRPRLRVSRDPATRSGASREPVDARGTARRRASGGARGAG